MVKVISRYKNIKSPKSTLSKEQFCPFNEGDLIKYKDEIFLVHKNKEGYFCINTECITIMKKLKPVDWTIFSKIS